MRNLAVIDEALDVPTRGYIDTAINTPRRTNILVSGDTTMGSANNTDYVAVVDAAATITLPAVNNNRYTVKRVGTGDVTVQGTSGQLIDGQATFVLTVQYQSIDLVQWGNTSGWVIV